MADKDSFNGPLGQFIALKNERRMITQFAQRARAWLNIRH